MIKKCTHKYLRHRQQQTKAGLQKSSLVKVSKSIIVISVIPIGSMLIEDYYVPHMQMHSLTFSNF